MRPPVLAVGVAVLLAAFGSLPGHAAGNFDVKLSADKQAIHVLNRLAFGPRPGEVEEVRRVGVEKWIRQQLSPAQIPENPAVDAKLKPLSSLRLATWEIYEAYQPPTGVRFATPNITQLLTSQQQQQLILSTSTPEQKRSVIDSLAPDVRRQVLSVAPPQAFEALPDIKQEATRAREIQQEIQSREIQEQQRRLRPPLNELLTPEQARDVQRGTDEEKRAVLTSLDPEKRKLVFRSPQLQGQIMSKPEVVPEAFRREAIAATNPQQAVSAELIEAKLLRAVYSTRQLEEVLVDFWLNHFNVFNGKGAVRMLVTSYERDAIRPHVLGRFHDMLLATARHPAMLFYLDNHLSRAAPDNSPLPTGLRVGLNENYGRELMELHTLGVGGGYTQDDVINVARAFTGWTIFQPTQYGEFQFDPSRHDRGEKVVLGHTIARGGGESDGLKVLDILARHPSTARFISRKLAQRFVADDPPQALVDRMATTFAKTDGDLRAVTEAMLLSREFLSEGAWQAKVKSPLEMVVSSLRALNANVTDTTGIAQRISELGQPLYGKPEPTGYPNTGEAWSSSAGLLGRINFATALVANEIVGVKVKSEILASADARRAFTEIVGVEPSPELMTAMDKSLGGKAPAPAVLATAFIASPDFQKR